MNHLKQLFKDFNTIFSDVNNLENIDFNKIIVNTDIEFIDMCS